MIYSIHKIKHKNFKCFTHLMKYYAAHIKDSLLTGILLVFYLVHLKFIRSFFSFTYIGSYYIQYFLLLLLLRQGLTLPSGLACSDMIMTHCSLDLPGLR